MEAPPGFEPGMELLQSSALPLGDGADRTGLWKSGEKPHRTRRGAAQARNTRRRGARREARRSRLERETGFEPATSTLARSHSTTELFPLARHVPRHGRGRAALRETQSYHSVPRPINPTPFTGGCRTPTETP